MIADSRSAPAGIQSASLAAHEPPPQRPPSASADTTATTTIAPSTKPALKPPPAEQVDPDSEFMFNPRSADLPPGHQENSGESYFSIPASTQVLFHLPHQYTLSSTVRVFASVLHANTILVYSHISTGRINNLDVKIRYLTSTYSIWSAQYLSTGIIISIILNARYKRNINIRLFECSSTIIFLSVRVVIDTLPDLMFGHEIFLNLYTYIKF